MNLLVVDPNKQSREELVTNLHLIFSSDQIYAVDNPLSAVHVASDTSIDLLFTDIRLRPLDGYELIKVLQQRQTFHSYVISGSREKPDVLDWMNISGYYPKPITLGELMHIHSQLDDDAK